ncbi:hypothetical protein [Leptotrichia trevisanii]|uniref:hypothetical protein n=1 Tax=Leptotrichia trevisanii TaxID=109328 RepID=UPI0026F10261|nr:hypothetical protein [Leptotrichia trevisanii]
MNSIDLKILKYISVKKKVRCDDLLKRFNYHSRDVLDIRINNILEYVSNYYDNNINDDIIEINPNGITFLEDFKIECKNKFIAELKIFSLKILTSIFVPIITSILTTIVIWYLINHWKWFALIFKATN